MKNLIDKLAWVWKNIKKLICSFWKVMLLEKISKFIEKINGMGLVVICSVTGPLNPQLD
jgi:hypothetical protein